MVRVDIEKLRKLKEERRKLNELSFDELEFYENGVKIDISESTKRGWERIGLNNDDFIEAEYWKNTFEGE